MRRNRKGLLIKQFLVLAVLAVWNAIGVYEGIYERVFIWDIVAHLLGGAWAALLVAWVLVHLGYRVSAWQCVLGAILIGVIWEGYEYYLDIIGSTFMQVGADTIKDLFVDAFGAACASYLWIVHRKSLLQ